MPYITIKTNMDDDLMTLHERVMPSDLESEVFCAHLVERLRWAVEDAHVMMPQPSSTATTAVGERGCTPGLVADSKRRRRDAEQSARLEF